MLGSQVLCFGVFGHGGRLTVYRENHCTVGPGMLGARPPHRSTGGERNDEPPDSQDCNPRVLREVAYHVVGLDSILAYSRSPAGGPPHGMVPAGPEGLVGLRIVAIGRLGWIVVGQCIGLPIDRKSV